MRTGPGQSGGERAGAGAAWGGRKTKQNVKTSHSFDDGVSVDNTKCSETMELLLSTQN